MGEKLTWIYHSVGARRRRAPTPNEKGCPKCIFEWLLVLAHYELHVHSNCAATP